MAQYKILHNPKCSKSRNALALLEAKKVSFEVQEYLTQNPSEAELKEILAHGDFTIKDIIRSKEAKEEGINLDVTEAQLIKALSKHPRIIQRPIVIKGKKSIIAREEGWFEKL